MRRVVRSKATPFAGLVGSILWFFWLVACSGSPAQISERAKGETTAKDTRAEVYVLRNVDVIPIDREELLSDQAVVIRDGEITVMGASDEVETPPGSTEIDGSGKYLIPGLFDMHVHFSEESEIAPYLPFGITTILSNHGTPFHLTLRDKINRGEVLGPRIFTSGPTVNQIEITTPEQAEQLVLDQKAAGYDFIKMYGDLPRELYSKLLATARAQGIHVGGHAPRNLPFSAVLEEGQNSIAHLEEILYTYKPIVAAINAHKKNLAEMPDLRPGLTQAVEELADRVKKAGLWVVPTLSGYEMIWMQITDQYQSILDRPEINYVHPVKRMEFGPKRNRYRQGLARTPAVDVKLRRSLDLQITMLRVFHEKGVPIVPGTDSSFPVNFPGVSLHRELELLVTCGFSNIEALRAATLTSARMLKADDEVGSVTIGKRADLLLLERNPLVDITATRTIAGVFRNGVWLPKSELDKKLEDLAERYGSAYKALNTFHRMLEEDGVLAAVRHFKELKPTDVDIFSHVESSINQLGYRYLRGNQHKKAIETFQANVELFPESANTYDSLAEAFLKRGDTEKAIEFYSKALAVDPHFSNATRMLEQIRKGQKKH